jgi:hypothetical protein
MPMMAMMMEPMMMDRSNTQTMMVTMMMITCEVASLAYIFEDLKINDCGWH